jgi:hypothetical protein
VRWMIRRRLTYRLVRNLSIRERERNSRAG